MENMAVADLKDGQIYRLDLVALRDNAYLKELGYDNSLIKSRFVTDLFYFRSDQGLVCLEGQELWITLPTSVHQKRRVKFVLEPATAAVDKKFSVVRRGNNDITGWDPEIFVVRANGDLIPAFEFLPSKGEPLFIAKTAVDYRPGLQVSSGAYWDGFQAEFSVIPGACHEYGFDRIRKGLRTVLNAAQKKFPDAKLTTKSVFKIPEAKMLGYSEEYVALGCDISLNAYGVDPFQIDNPFKLPYRMAGGHVHLGFREGPPSIQDAEVFVKYIDFLATIPSIGMFADVDDPIRRQYYGRAGEYRLPPHGLEYRTLSNAWLGHPAIGHVLMDLVRKGTGNIRQLFNIAEIGLTDDYIRDVINNSDVKAARAVFKDNIGIWGALHGRHYGTGDSIKMFERAVMQGVESILPNFHDIKGNWKLDPDERWDERSNRHAGGTWGSLLK